MPDVPSIIHASSIVQAQAPAELGPKLRKRLSAKREDRLTKRQMQFVDLIAGQHRKPYDALKEMGYTDSAARRGVWYYLRHPLVAAEIVQRSNELLAAALPRAAERLVQLLNSKSDYVSLEAAKDLLDRGGVKDKDVQSNTQLVVNISL